jgi:hypothetical protein
VSTSVGPRALGQERYVDDDHAGRREAEVASLAPDHPSEPETSGDTDQRRRCEHRAVEFVQLAFLIQAIIT